MPHWLDDYPVLRIKPETIAAADYNRIRLALLRHTRPTPLHIPLSTHRCLEGILDAKAWVCIDNCQNRIPILAWTDFETRQRTALNAPVQCRLRMYHQHAGLLMGKVLEAMATALSRGDHQSHRATGPG